MRWPSTSLRFSIDVILFVWRCKVYNGIQLFNLPVLRRTFLRTFYCSPNRNEWIIRNCNNVKRRERAGGRKKSFIKTTIREIRLSWVIYYSIQLLVPRCCHISFNYFAIRLILCRIKVIGKIAHPRDYSWILFLARPTDRHCQYLWHLPP